MQKMGAFLKQHCLKLSFRQVQQGEQVTWGIQLKVPGLCWAEDSLTSFGILEFANLRPAGRDLE
jgi:hypothetical protein